MKKAIGIDLGTTNSVVAFKDTSVKILRNKEGDELTRSCVGFKDEIIVGKVAYQLLGRDPINTIRSVKRLMGSTLKDKAVIDLMNSGHYKYGITSYNDGTDDAVAVVLGGKQYRPEQISAKILKKLKDDAEEKLGDEVTHAVITVPAYFTERQKNATLKAAEIAGLKVQKLLAEPTAAAIAYGVDNLKPGDATTVMIYDFGGGTFDLSILTIVDGEYIAAGTGGDRWLGGDDIDRKLQALILNKVAQEYSINDISKLIQKLPEKRRYQFEGQILFQTEAAKIQLSSTNSASVTIDSILEDENGDIIDIDISITRQEFEKIVKPFVERSIELIETLLKEVGYDIGMLDKILLVGGTSCIPLVKQMLSERYGAEKIKISEKPMLAVAEGAAILSHRLDDSYERSPDDSTAIGEISYSASHNYYIEVADDNVMRKERIIEKLTPLPAKTSKTFKTTTNNQKVVKVALFSDPEKGDFGMQALGYYLIKENLPIQSELVFDFQLDTNEILTVNVYPKGKRNQEMQIILGRGNIDHKALDIIDTLINKSTREFRTADGEEEFVNFVTKKITEIEKEGVANISDNKWHEVFYTTTEKYDEIKSTENRTPKAEKAIFRAKRLLMEFGELLDQFDKGAMIELIKQIETTTEDEEKNQLVDLLIEKYEQYGVLNVTLQIESYAERILEIPGTTIGSTSKQADYDRLIRLYNDAKIKFKSGSFDNGKELVNQAFTIIEKYDQWL
ncbi:MAG: Hsp70 family protein [Flavipsychrobacter sp.]|nr:Hsp70 family protein [Flavipsychrobacter sp.]